MNRNSGQIASQIRVVATLFRAVVAVVAAAALDRFAHHAEPLQLRYRPYPTALDAVGWERR